MPLPAWLALFSLAALVWWLAVRAARLERLLEAPPVKAVKCPACDQRYSTGQALVWHFDAVHRTGDVRPPSYNRSRNGGPPPRQGGNDHG